MPRKKNTVIVPARQLFRTALASAKQALAAKTKERNRTITLLRQLNVDIPNLERTVKALEEQLGGTGPVTRPTSQSDNNQVGGVPPKLHLSEVGSFTKEQMNEMFPGSTGEIPPDVLAQLPPEDFSKFGAKYGVDEEEKFLPEIEGKPVIPEKQ
jgi:hypothetical protein